MTEWQSIIGSGVIQNSYGSFVRSERKPTEPLFHHYIDTDETLPGIALKYGTTLEELRRINKLHYTDSIQSRQYLLVPGQKNDSTSKNPTGKHVRSENPKSSPKKVQKPYTNGTTTPPQESKVVDDSVHDFLKKLDKQISSTKKVTTTMLSEKKGIEITNTSYMPSAKFMRRKPSFDSSTETKFSKSNSFHQDEDDLFKL